MIATLLACTLATGFAAPSMHLVVNIPAFRLEVCVGDSLVRTIAIAPGMPAFKTPRGTFAIGSIEWNPWWIPPKSPWAAKEKPTPPGPKNPMGPVKLNFGPMYFVHGTPLEQSIGSAASHGCIRLAKADALSLARLTLHYGLPSLSAEDIERVSSDTAWSHTIKLDEPVRIDIRYDLVDVRDGRVWVYRDVYGLGTRAMLDEVTRALADHGVDTTAIDTARVRALVHRIVRSGSSSSIDSLVKAPWPQPERPIPSTPREKSREGFPRETTR